MDNLHFIKELGYRTKDALESGDLHGFACLMDSHSQRKRHSSGDISNPRIDRLYECAIRNGALRGKLIGAGGFLMFYTDDKQRLRHAMRQEGLNEVRFRFDFGGTRIVSQD